MMDDRTVEQIVDKRVMIRLATDRAYLNAENAEEQEEREEQITREEWIRATKERASWPALTPRKELPPMLKTSYLYICVVKDSNGRVIGRFGTVSPNRAVARFVAAKWTQEVAEGRLGCPPDSCSYSTVLARKSFNPNIYPIFTL
jgi:hypothetical protein